jgi:dihydroneopterin aldolase
MTIHVENFTFEVLIGILEKEKEFPQSVIVNAQIDYDYVKNSFINYALVCELIEENMLLGEYELIEDALLALEEELKETFPQITALNLKISKPQILPNCIVSVALKKKY